MKSNLFISLILTVLLVPLSSNSFASGNLSTAPNPSSAPASRSSAQPAKADSPSVKPVEQPPTAKLAAQGQKVFLKLNKSVKQVQILVSGKKLGTLGKGSVFDITGYLHKSRADRFEFLFPYIKDAKGKPYSTTLSVARFRAKISREQKAKPETAPIIMPARISIQNISLKDNRVQVQIRKIGKEPFSNQAFVVGKLVVEHQGREHDYPLLKLCTLSQLNLGRNLVLDSGHLLTEKSRLTISFKRIVLDRPRTVTLNPVQMIASPAVKTPLARPLIPATSPPPPPSPGPPPPPPPGPGPDVGDYPNLAIVNVTVTRSSLIPGQFTINAQVKNNGLPCEDGFNVSFGRVNGSTLESTYIAPPLQTFETRDLTFPFSSLECASEIRLHADSNNVITESDEIGQNYINDEQDNVWWGVAEGPGDLAVSMSLDPSTLQLDLDSGLVAVTVRNVGCSATSTGAKLSIFLTDFPPSNYSTSLTPAGGFPLPALPREDDYTLTRSVHIQTTHNPTPGGHSIPVLPGEYRLSATLDTQSLPPGNELSGENNSAELKFQVTRPSPYDLVLLGVTLTQDNRLKIRLKNAGPKIPQDIYDQLRLSVSLDDGAPKYLPISVVDPDGTLQAAAPQWWDTGQTMQTFVWPTPATNGSMGLDALSLDDRIKVEAKIGLSSGPGGGVYFSHDEHPANNSKTVYLGGTPDLVVCFKKYNAHHVGSNSYSPKVRNIGNAPSAPVNLRFWIKDKGTKNYGIPAIPAGGVYSGVKRDVYWVLSGSRDFSLHVDNNHEVDEGEGESNNIIRGSILVKRLQHSIVSGQNSATRCSDAPGMAD